MNHPVLYYYKTRQTGPPNAPRIAIALKVPISGIPIMQPVAVRLYAVNKNSLHQVQSLSLFHVLIHNLRYALSIIYLRTSELIFFQVIP